MFWVERLSCTRPREAGEQVSFSDDCEAPGDTDYITFSAALLLVSCIVSLDLAVYSRRQQGAGGQEAARHNNIDFCPLHHNGVFLQNGRMAGVGRDLIWFQHPGTSSGSMGGTNALSTRAFSGSFSAAPSLLLCSGWHVFLMQLL